MKHTNLANALDKIQDEYILEAAKEKPRHFLPRKRASDPNVYVSEVGKEKRRILPWAGAIAAVAAIFLGASLILPGNQDNSLFFSQILSTKNEKPHNAPDAPAQTASPIAQPEYPEMAPCPTLSDSMEDYWEAYDQWQEGLGQQYDQPSGYAMYLDGFFMDSAPVFLGDGRENTVYSPANVYMALAMLAETTGGETRQEILELLRVSSIEDLREQTGHLWNANYRDDGVTKLLLANSLWLDSTLPYKAEAPKTLAQRYYASVYHGDLGTEEMNAALRTWINENTGGLLQEQAADLALDDRTLLALASTIHYQVKWGISFLEEQTKAGVFHGPNGDETVDYMYSSFPAIIEDDYDCSWVSIPLEDGCQMRLILPKEGYTPQDILASDHLKLKLSGQTVYSKVPPVVDVNLQLPKFDVASETDLRQGLEKLGITKVFSPDEADFSGITGEQLYLSKADHTARVKIDEEGIEAAAYTVLQAPGTGAPIEKEEVDFILDRPFLFVIEGRNGVPLFIGVVNEP